MLSRRGFLHTTGSATLGAIAMFRDDGQARLEAASRRVEHRNLEDVAADEDRCRGTRGFHHDPGLRMRARPAAARTTVRVPGWGDGRGTALTLGLLRPSRARAPARHQPRRLFARR